jgi:predicted 3-demethylubiquinone-9 3-methyltransferase (glyoxalase superfamily)
MSAAQTITTYLWFNGNAKEAVDFYTAIFPASKVSKVARWGEGGPAPAGSVMTIAFELANQAFIALNGGPEFVFTPAISLLVTCKNQEELDRMWSDLTADGGKPGRCGWLVDKFGVSWQVVPEGLGDLMTGADSTASGRVGQALMGMHKLDIGVLRRAHAGA